MVRKGGGSRRPEIVLDEENWGYTNVGDGTHQGWDVWWMVRQGGGRVGVDGIQAGPGGLLSSRNRPR